MPLYRVFNRAFAVEQESQRFLFQHSSIKDLDGGLPFQQAVDGVVEVPDVRAEGHGGAVGGGLDHVLAAATVRLPPTKATSARPTRTPSSPIVSSRIDGVTGWRADGVSQLAAADERHAGACSQVGHLVEAVLLPGDEDQPQVRVRAATRRKIVEDDLLLRRLRAAGDPDQLPRRVDAQQ